MHAETGCVNSDLKVPILIAGSADIRVNFINVKCENFTCESIFSSYVLALNKFSYKKRAGKTLMKWTQDLVCSVYLYSCLFSSKFNFRIFMTPTFFDIEM